MGVHHLKVWPREYEAIVDGLKAHEVRATHDRIFEVGDTLHLSEWSHLTQVYTGRRVRVRVTYVSRGPDWGLPTDLAVMSIALEREV